MLSGVISSVMLCIILVNLTHGLTFSSLLPALNAKALHYKETLCKTSEVQRFLNTLVSKPPEVGHYVSCSHPAKSGPDPKTPNAPGRKVCPSYYLLN